MASVTLWPYSAEILFESTAFVAVCRLLQMPFHGKSFLRKQLLSHGTAGSFSEDRPEGGTLLP